MSFFLLLHALCLCVCGERHSWCSPTSLFHMHAVFCFCFCLCSHIFFFCERLVCSSWFSLSSPHALATKFSFDFVFSFSLSATYSPGEIVPIEFFPPRGIARTPVFAFSERKDCALVLRFQKLAWYVSQPICLLHHRFCWFASSSSFHTKRT